MGMIVQYPIVAAICTFIGGCLLAALVMKIIYPAWKEWSRKRNLRALVRAHKNLLAKRPDLFVPISKKRKGIARKIQ